MKSELVSKFWNKQSSPWDDETPISAEIFGLERLTQHARSLAADQIPIRENTSAYPIADRLDENAKVLRDIYQEFCSEVANGDPVTPAAEWLIDNFHLVEQHIGNVRQDLSPAFYRQLPKVSGGPLPGYPRIFSMAWGFIAHTDSSFQPETLTHFLDAYQEVQPLTIGELWATAIALRLTLIENLRRISVGLKKAGQERQKADKFADQLLSSKAESPFPFFSGADRDFSPTFAVQLIQRLRDLEEPQAIHGLSWLQQRLAEMDQTFDAIVLNEHHRQAAANVTVRNIVNSLRLISDVNWQLWFDGVSLVERTLMGNATYAAMDFRSRNLYRTAIEQLCRRSPVAENEVAQLAVTSASKAEGLDPGFFLLGPGRREFETRISHRPGGFTRLRAIIRSSGLLGYLGLASALTFALVIVATLPLTSLELDYRVVALLCLLVILPASEIAFAVVNQLVCMILESRILPGFSFRDGVPAQFKSLVVMPVLLTEWQSIDTLLEKIETHYLANGTGEVYFGLLSDWVDAPLEAMPEDDALLERATKGIEALNAHYNTNRFIVLHRRRLWNPSQSKWMGWERKRGKLEELNRLLRGATNTSFMVAPETLPQDIKYVVTLDQDTRMPRDTVRFMVGKIAHPFNRPAFDEKLGRVVSGHAILQPRVSASLPVDQYGSLYQKLFSTTRGMDPYVWAASDVYQDLFDEGSFAGKGIYDIDAFELALSQRVPENTLLSHDLFEGVFARAALLSDIEVIEDYPERYEDSAARVHRWTRGDWQLLPWLVPGAKAATVPALGKWKMIDNLRRSLVPISQMMALFVAGLNLGAVSASLWTTGIILTVMLPPLLPTLMDALKPQGWSVIRNRLRLAGSAIARGMAVGAANLAFLPSLAALMVDAVLRTLYRLLISRHNLLEWTTAAQVQAKAKSGIVGYFLRLWPGPFVGLFVIGLNLLLGKTDWYWLLPFAFLWMVSPVLALWMSQPALLEREIEPTDIEYRALRLIARQTWRFFDTYVMPENNALPPDNFQEDPKPAVANRTSPTNIGLYLLSAAAARDFGWISTLEIVERAEATLATCEKLEKYRGHLLNWYDTVSLMPLEPRYVSSVDSGNLAGHLIAMANYCDDWRMTAQSTGEVLEGIEDPLNLTLESLPTARKEPHRSKDKIRVQAEILQKMIDRLRAEPFTLSVRLIELSIQAKNLQQACAELGEIGAPAFYWSSQVLAAVEGHFREAISVPDAQRPLNNRLSDIAKRCRELAYAMEFGFLLDPKRDLLSIGYRVAEGMLDENCYDLLASEARLASFFAIAKGDIPTRHWYKLGRTTAWVMGGAALISWSGSMFEYLMPSLVMRSPIGGLLEQTTHLIVDKQQAYGEKLDVPWGISESAFSARDIGFTYQYSNFGVPGLGLKRGLGDDLVIAPYATGLAAMVSPRRAAQNYVQLSKAGGKGNFGFYEALDFTPERLLPKTNVSIVKAYFAHHQGMTIVALGNALQLGRARDMFHQEPTVRASELLLQERVPREMPQPSAVIQAAPEHSAVKLAPIPPRTIDPLQGTTPATQVLSNGQLSVMHTATGGGYTSWMGTAVTRWREDPTCDVWGQFFYIRDIRQDKWWTAGHSPGATPPDSSTALFSEHQVELSRTDGDWHTGLECIVSPETNAEARRITITNDGAVSREIEITTYAELALAKPEADAAHPAFSKMFVETEFVEDLGVLLATRRRRSHDEEEIWVAQTLVVEAARHSDFEFETDRAKFIGRCNDVRDPAAMKNVGPLGKSSGTVLDPVFALRCRLRLPKSRKVRLTLWTMVAASRQAVMDLVDQHRQVAAFDRAQILAWTQAQIELRHLGSGLQDAHDFQELASYVLYSNPGLRAAKTTLERDSGPQTALWSQGISGDRPIVLLRIDSVDDIPVARELIKAFTYWKTKRIPVDLVLLNERMSSYIQDLQQGLEAAAASMRKVDSPDREGKLYLLRKDMCPPDALKVLTAAARVDLSARPGNLATQLARLRFHKLRFEPTRNMPAGRDAKSRTQLRDVSNLLYYNGYGGFAKDGKEYVSFPSPDAPTPAPWSNIIANPEFGYVCTNDGAGSTWIGNSREAQITGWSNDPVTNQPSQAIYIKDQKSGDIISPTLLPVRDGRGSYEVRHGFGYSVFKRVVTDLQIELTQWVPHSDTILLSRLVLNSTGQQTRNFSLTYYAEWALGSQRSHAAHHMITEADVPTGAFFARNNWSPQFRSQVAFMDMGGKQQRWTGDRFEFIGKFGSMSNPDCLAQDAKLSNFAGSGADPCGALQAAFTIAPGETVEFTLALGAAENTEAARGLVTKYRTLNIEGTLQAAKNQWSETLGAVVVKTPDPAFDLILNGWLLYQALACRMWARAGFYQASGAYGFRDQLQDSMALLYARPELARAQILRAASRQFPEGDVQHWWLPESGNGIRTRISDDAIWLSYCTAHYLAVTGDLSILEEKIAFVEGQRLQDNEQENFFLPTISGHTATLFEHCALGLDYSLKFGAHGLPLMGTGDWNDGMNRVGIEGKGESVWLAWFMIKSINDLLAATPHVEDPRKSKWGAAAAAMTKAIEENAWDGKWYRRAYYDDGTPLGSSQNDECAIDAIPQSWSVISGAGNAQRSALAMDEVHASLVDRDAHLALLFKPPFNNSVKDPGYVKAYPPGIRENGGQYTHGATWSVFAFAALGQSQQAWELYELLNPITHAREKTDSERYRVEPYVVAADIYSMGSNRGRGGWTWYTGSAAWLYRAGLEGILGLRKSGDTIYIKPCMPPGWDSFTITMKHSGKPVELHIERSQSVTGNSQGLKQNKLGEFEVFLPDAIHGDRLALTIPYNGDADTLSIISKNQKIS